MKIRVTVKMIDKAERTFLDEITISKIWDVDSVSEAVELMTERVYEHHYGMARIETTEIHAEVQS